MTNANNPIPITCANDEDRDYWRKRAEDHRRLAEKSAEAANKTLHLRFCRLYLDRAGKRAGVLQD